MDKFLKQIEQMGYSADRLFHKDYSDDLMVWHIKSINSSTALKLLRKNHEDVFTNKGLLYQCTRHVPTLSIADLASADKVQRALSEEYTVDIFYLPTVLNSYHNLTTMAYHIADIIFDFGDQHEEVASFLFNLSKICTFVPYEIEHSFLSGRLKNVVDLNSLEQFLKKKYIPLLSSLGRLENSPAHTLTEVLKSMFIII